MTKSNPTVRRTMRTEDVLNYAQDLQAHQDCFRAHLDGKLETPYPLLPSFLPPASYWTSSEKDLFFHGLSIYSRFRPDMIAGHIKSKSTLDVCLFLDALQRGAEQDIAVHKASTNYRNDMDQAMEVTDEWVAREEALAASLTEASTCRWSVANSENDSCSSHTKHECTCPYDQHRVPEQGGASSSGKMEVDEYLNHLDSTCLMVLESIIREAEAQEPGDLESDVYTQESKQHGKHGTETNGPPASAADEEMLDLEPNNQSLDTLTDAHTRNDIDGIHKHDIDDAEMRRRIKNRIYMRRKRAEKAGRPILPGIVKLRPGRQIRERKPPKPRPTKYKSRKSTRGPTKEPSCDSHDPKHDISPRNDNASDSGDEHLQYEKHSKGGVTKMYRIKKIFLDNGIDDTLLKSLELNFFSFSAVRRLFRLLHLLDGNGQVSVSTHTMLLASGILKEFVSEIVRRVIITKEQEIRLKRSLKIWKYDRDEITGENMAECLNTMGLGSLKEKLFQRMSVGQEENVPQPNPEILMDDEKKALRSRSTQFTLPQSLLWCCFPNAQKLPVVDDVLPEEIDEAALQRELDEEEELDAEDAAKSKEYQDSLWNIL
ncbi:hypothetical protein CPC08DRAFT_703723 [Agrocybe pediades]|nr:hypothetical protein CPC08DRAFT_703723 [Agrocybe pediades]